MLFSIHDEDVPVSACCACAPAVPGLIEDAKEVLLVVRRRCGIPADTLENIYDELEGVSKQVLAGDVTDTRAKCGHRPPGRLERPHPPQRDGHAPRGELHDAQQDAQRRAVRGSAPDPARHRVAGQPHGLLFEKSTS